jgi:murein DD-endopeptidase MepM/ murein hydrolase activator NlpD
MPFDFSKFVFAHVIKLPETYEVYDFSAGYDPNRKRTSPFGVGRYNERRPGMYRSEIFSAESQNARDIHVGVDIAAPVGTPVHAFYEGAVFMADINPAKGDYGGTLITKHVLATEAGHERVLYALFGHLSHASVKNLRAGTVFKSGDRIAHVGDRTENGGWNPHLHFQLSWMQPERCDLPGVVNEKDLPWALATFPDPRLVLGQLY